MSLLNSWRKFKNFAVVRTVSGTEAEPAVAVGADDTGLYRRNDGDLSMVVGGTERARIDVNNVNLKEVFKFFGFTFQVEKAAYGSDMGFEWDDTGEIVELYFDAGTNQPSADDVVTGSLSGATGTVVSVARNGGGSGAWNGDEVGILTLKDVTGTFQNNDVLTVGATTIATVDGIPYDDESFFRKLIFRKRGSSVHFRNLSRLVNVITWSMLAPANAFVIDRNGYVLLGKLVSDAGATDGIELAGDDIYVRGSNPSLSLNRAGVNHIVDTASGGMRVRFASGTQLAIMDDTTERVRINPGGVAVGAGGAGNGTNTLAIYNGTAPSAAQVNAVLLYSKDLSAGNTMPGIRTEGTGALSLGTASVAGTLAVEINGTTYHIMLASAAAT